MKAGWIAIALVAAGCASTAPRTAADRNDYRGAAVTAAPYTAGDECRRMMAERPVVPSTLEPRIGSPWWTSTPNAADPSRAVLKDDLRAASPCPLEQ